MQPWRCDHAGTFCVGEIVQTPDKLLLFNVSASPNEAEPIENRRIRLCIFPVVRGEISG